MGAHHRRRVTAAGLHRLRLRRWLVAKQIHDGIARRLREGGFASLSEAVGSATRKR
ncbi:putative dihydroorotate dehydrogenase 2 [Mycobacterium xenopi 3993]|nr:putative dihydroorotate dehydrogenase 2 [Mycobacterium xenopi 3993]